MNVSRRGFLIGAVAAAAVAATDIPKAAPMKRVTVFRVPGGVMKEPGRYTFSIYLKPAEGTRLVAQEEGVMMADAGNGWVRYVKTFMSGPHVGGLDMEVPMDVEVAEMAQLEFDPKPQIAYPLAKPKERPRPKVVSATHNLLPYSSPQRRR